MRVPRSQASTAGEIPQRGFTRRDLMKGTLGLGAMALLPGCATSGATRTEIIHQENAQPGTRDWMLTHTRVDPATKYRCPWIEGYCSHTSAQAGEKVEFCVSTNPVSAFRIEIYRMGYYGGTGGRLVKSLGPFQGKAQPDPPVGEKRLRDCHWEPCAALEIPDDWVSGVYLAKLTAERDGWQSYIIFVVRDHRQADFIFQCSDTTWQAYNRWPSQFSLYDNGEHQWWWGGDVQVSFNRPYGKYCQILDAPLSTGSGEWFLWEFPFAFWLESQGYDVTYISNLDTHADGSSLMRAKGFLSVGHDEYWSIEMFHHVQSAVARGLNVGFFSGNAVCGRILFAPDARGRRDRAYERVGVFGPPGGTHEFQAMSSLATRATLRQRTDGRAQHGPGDGRRGLGLRETGSLGVRGHGNEAGRWHSGPGRLGMARGSREPSRPRSGRHRTDTVGSGIPNGGQFTATVYPGPLGNFVFNASTCWWADSLSAPPGYVRPSVYTSPRGPDIRAQQITRNVLERMRHAGHGS